MDEEQKQAIKELKHFTNMTVFWKEKEYTSHEIDNCINIVLHLIDKQQKEIEKLKSRKYILNAETNEIKEIPISDDYISKDKIKEEIENLKQYKEEIKDEKDFEYFTTLRIIKALRKLLEK